MTKHLFLFFFEILICLTVQSQYEFVENGRIIFERRVNTYSILPAFVLESKITTREELALYVQDYKSRNPQFWIDSFQLVFDKEATSYEPILPVSIFLHGIGIPMSNANKIYINHSKEIFFAEKNVYNETKLINDSIVKIQWKFTEETREIAGYECRRANAIIRDSVYVVAFYTDAIKSKGGPEMFNGLPGMILGLALPKYHISYFAKRVELDAQFSKPDLPKLESLKDGISQKVFNNDALGFFKKMNMNTNWFQVFIGL